MSKGTKPPRRPAKDFRCRYEGGFIVVPRRMLTDIPDLNLIQRMVLAVLFNHTQGRKKPTCFPGLRKIAGELGINKNSAELAINHLLKTPYLEKIENHDEKIGRSTLYRLNFDAIDQVLGKMTPKEELAYMLSMGYVVEKDGAGIKVTHRDPQIMKELMDILPGATAPAATPTPPATPTPTPVPAQPQVKQASGLPQQWLEFDHKWQTWAYTQSPDTRSKISGILSKGAEDLKVGIGLGITLASCESLITGVQNRLHDLRNGTTSTSSLPSPGIIKGDALSKINVSDL